MSASEHEFERWLESVAMMGKPELRDKLRIAFMAGHAAGVTQVRRNMESAGIVQNPDGSTTDHTGLSMLRHYSTETDFDP